MLPARYKNKAYKSYKIHNPYQTYKVYGSQVMNFHEPEVSVSHCLNFSTSQLLSFLASKTYCYEYL